MQICITKIYTQFVFWVIQSHIHTPLPLTKPKLLETQQFEFNRTFAECYRFKDPLMVSESSENIPIMWH